MFTCCDCLLLESEVLLLLLVFFCRFMPWLRSICMRNIVLHENEPRFQLLLGMQYLKPNDVLYFIGDEICSRFFVFFAAYISTESEECKVVNEWNQNGCLLCLSRNTHKSTIWNECKYYVSRCGTKDRILQKQPKKV